jgi:hypothetical protein
MPLNLEWYSDSIFRVTTFSRHEDRQGRYCAAEEAQTHPSRRRGFVQRIQVELDSSSNEAPTSSRSICLREIHCQIDHKEVLKRRLAHSTKLLRDAERIAMAHGRRQPSCTSSGSSPREPRPGFALEIPRNDPLPHPSRQVTGSSQGRTASQRSTGRRGGKA